MPIVRTFVTLVAGVGKMDFRKFITYTAIGGVLWACGVTTLGYYLGNIPFIQNNIEAGADPDRARLADPDGGRVRAAPAPPQAGIRRRLTFAACRSVLMSAAA